MLYVDCSSLTASFFVTGFTEMQLIRDKKSIGCSVPLRLQVQEPFTPLLLLGTPALLLDGLAHLASEPSVNGGVVITSAVL
jgi:hypothetical protein